MLGQEPEFGTYQLGRLTYRTPNEARGAARDLGLSDVHTHDMDGETVFRPGASCAELEKQVKKNRLLPPYQCGGGKQQDSMGFGLGTNNGGGGLL